jgi:hypothetical protein
MTTNQPQQGVMGAVSGLIRLAVVLWLGWFAVVGAYVLATEVPVVAIVVAAAGMTLVIRRWRYRRQARRDQIAWIQYCKAEHHRQERLNRAQQYPDLVWEDNVAQWNKEMSRE